MAVLAGAFPDAVFTVMPDDAIRVVGPEAETVGRALLEAEVPVSGLYLHARDREDYFVELMGDGTGAVRGAAGKGGGSDA